MAVVEGGDRGVGRHGFLISLYELVYGYYGYRYWNMGRCFVCRGLKGRGVGGNLVI